MVSPAYLNKEGRLLSQGFFFIAGRISQSTVYSVLYISSEGGEQEKYTTSPLIVLGTMF